MTALALRPYSGTGDDTLPDNVKALPDHAKAIWVAAFNSAWKSWDSGSTDLAQEQYAFAVAWAAVKKLYKKVDGDWQKRERVVAGDGYFTRVWEDQAGVRRWKATSGDDGVDQYATRMTRDFQLDMCARAALKPPWLGISHYGKFGQIGIVDRVYLDGRKLKAEGRWLTETPDDLQRELVAAAYAAALEESSLLPAHRTIRTSIAFFPEAFEIEDCGVVAYTRGYLEHIALTTRPANSRADFGLDEEDVMPGKRSQTRREMRRDDAAAIIGDELAGRLFEIEGKVGDERSAEDDGLVYRMAGGELEVSPDGGDTWQPATEPQARAMVPVKKFPLNDAADPWDAGAARKRVWEKATDADGNFDAAVARQAFAIYDSENPENKTAMILPHHDVAGDSFTTHQRGVMAAGGVVQGAHGGFKEFQSGDQEAAKTHLGAHYAQMDRTPPWEAERTNLRHRAEALWAMELLMEPADALDVVYAELRADLLAGSVAKPTLAEAIAMFEGAHDVGSALLRATGIPDFAGAIAAVISDPEALDIPQLERAGRRIKGEVIAEMQAAIDNLGEMGASIKSLKGILEWARENLPDDAGAAKGRAAPEKRAPDASILAVLKERWGNVEPDDTVIGTMTEAALKETAYTAGYSLLDIIIANIEADPADLPLAERLTNVQKALDEFGQIMNQVMSQSAVPRSAAGDGGAANSDGVKSGDGDGGTVKSPPDEPDARASADIEAILADARTFADSDDRTAEGAQAILDRMGGYFRDLLEPDEPEGPTPSDVTDAVAAALTPLLERMDSFERIIERLVLPAAIPVGDGEGYVPAPPRRANIASPRRGVQPSLLPLGPRRLDASRGMKPADFAKGAHRSGTDPRMGS